MLMGEVALYATLLHSLVARPSGDAVLCGMAQGTLCPCRGTSLIRNTHPLGPP